MARGTRDYGTGIGESVTHSITDVGELAARLGSIVNHDRRGNVLALYDFENSLASVTTGTQGVGSAVTRDTSIAFCSDASVKLHAATGTGNFARIVSYIGGNFETGVGLAFKFAPETTAEKLMFVIGAYAVDYYYVGRIDYFHDDKAFKILKPDSSLETIITLDNDLVTSTIVWNYFKLVINTNSEKYVRLIFNGEEYDLSEYDLSKTVQSQQDRALWHVTVFAGAGTDYDTYVDNVIITINEE